MPRKPIPSPPLIRLEVPRLTALLEAEHRQRMEYARIEYERRIELIEAEAALIDARCRRLASEITPGNERLDAMAGTFSAPAGIFKDEEMPY